MTPEKVCIPNYTIAPVTLCLSHCRPHRHVAQLTSGLKRPVFQCKRRLTLLCIWWSMSLAVEGA